MDQLISMLKKLVTTDLRPTEVREFHEAVRAAVRDGKLAESEIAELEKRREELGLSAEVLSAVRQDIYLEAFTHVTENAEVTEDEWEELEQIQDYLGLQDADIAPTKKELYRMRILSEIKKGNMPVQTDALSDVVLKQHEIVHWIEPVELLTPVSGSKQEFTGITVDLPLLQGIRLGFETPAKSDGWSRSDSGDLVVTDKRVLFTGSKGSLEIPLSSIVHARCFRNGVRIDAKGEHIRFFCYRSEGNHNLIGSIVVSAIDIHRRK